MFEMCAFILRCSSNSTPRFRTIPTTTHVKFIIVTRFKHAIILFVIKHVKCTLVTKLKLTLKY